MRLLIVLSTLALPVAPALAVDLTKIDRSIAKQPAYDAKPKYCLAVFGPKAEMRVWLVLDGNTRTDRAAGAQARWRGTGHSVLPGNAWTRQA